MDDLRKLAEAEIEARAQDQTTYAWTRAEIPHRILKLLDVVEALQRIITADDAHALSQQLIERGRAALSGAGTRTASDE